MALMANVDPNSTNRALWACKAHDAYMYYMTEILKTSCGAGICNSNILAGGQGGDWGTGIGETLDWIYSSFSSGDKATIMAAQRKAAQMLVTQAGITSGYPTPVGLNNDPALATNYGYNRTTGNNYFSLHVAQLTSMGAAWDAADDPTTANCAGGRDQVCSDGSANSMHAYLKDAMGAYLYLIWLNYDDPYITTSAYNAQFGTTMSPTYQCSATPYISLPAPCYGNGRGGLSHEGVPLYIGSLNKLRETFNMLHTAGLDDPLVLGPQLSFATSSWWDLMVQGTLKSTTPATYQTVQPMFSYNEVNATFDLTAFVAQIFGNLLHYDQMTGRSDRTNELAWLTSKIATQYSYSTLVYNNTWFGLDGFLYLPAGPSTFAALGATDPRGSMPDDYYSLNAGRLIAGTGWTSTDAIFESVCPIYPSQDHEMDGCGRFAFYRNGDFATKGLDGYCENNQVVSNGQCLPDYSNFPAYQNDPADPNYPDTLYYINPQIVRGGQMNHQMGNALNISLQSFMPGYVAQHLDATGGYNYIYPAYPCDTSGCSGNISPRTDVQSATRDFLWIKPYYLAIYDRGDTSENAFKKDWFIATGPPTISGNNVSWTSSLGTLSVYLHNLLPSGATVSNQPVESGLPMSAGAAVDYAPNTRILIDAGTPTSARFLNVMEAQNYGSSATGATLVQSTAGQGFDGTLIGSSLVMFMRNLATFSSVTYPASGATTHYISDLAPNTNYIISGAGAPASATTDAAGVLTFSAAGSGNITISPAVKAGTAAGIGTSARIGTVVLCAAAAFAVSFALSSRSRKSPVITNPQAQRLFADQADDLHRNA
jgi:hypothetical protein